MYPLKTKVPYNPATLKETTHIFTTTYLWNYISGDVQEYVGSHVWVDIVPQCPKDEVYSVLPGKIIKAESNSYNGNFVIIEHGNVPHPSQLGITTTLYSCYLHLDSLWVLPQQIVDEGTVIGFSGNTWNSTGEHLHFQIDTKDAPFHPYWPFSLAEAKSAGYGFVDATNAGLNMDLWKKYTVNPLVYLDSIASRSISIPVPPPTENASGPKDVPANAPYRTALEYLQNKQIVDVAEYFRPNDSLTRAELLKITLLSAWISVSGVVSKKKFQDIPTDSWYAPYFAAAYNKNITKGYSDGTMRPNNAVTRAEAAKILYSTHQYEVPQLSFSVFSDVTLQDWFVQYANYLYATQIFWQTQFQAQLPLKRWEAMMMLHDVLRSKE